jgi:hypothetical protein
LQENQGGQERGCGSPSSPEPKSQDPNAQRILIFVSIQKKNRKLWSVCFPNRLNSIFDLIFDCFAKRGRSMLLLHANLPSMLINWPKEFELLLLDDPRFERGKSRFGENIAFFYEGKELAHFHQDGLDIRLTAAGIFALGPRLAEDCVISVAKDWVLVRLCSDEDTKFAMALIEKAIREAHNSQPGPKGKQTRRATSKIGESQATRAFGIAKALKELQNLDPVNATKKIRLSEKPQKVKKGPRKKK